MPKTSDQRPSFGDPAAVAARLRALPVTLSAVKIRVGTLAIVDYDGGARPTGLCAVSGAGATGFGEHVAFSTEEQRAFTAVDLPRGRHTVGDLLKATSAPPFARAALEAAVIDLALRQGRLSFFDLTGRRRVRLRWLTSFGAADPVARLRALRSAGANELKIDVDPAWPPAVIAALAEEPGITILDFKDQGTVDLCQRLRAAFPQALFEDPPPGYSDPLVTRDRSLQTPSDVAAAVARGEGINVKAPRMGGPLAALAALGGAAGHEPRYFGGMFEVGPGRAQARQLAAHFCATGPNDLGPVGDEPAPEIIDLQRPGFGATADWGAIYEARLRPL